MLTVPNLDTELSIVSVVIWGKDPTQSFQKHEFTLPDVSRQNRAHCPFSWHSQNTEMELDRLEVGVGVCAVEETLRPTFKVTSLPMPSWIQRADVSAGCRVLFLTAFGKTPQLCQTETFLFHGDCSNGEQKRVRLPSSVVPNVFEAPPCPVKSLVSFRKRTKKSHSWGHRWTEKRARFSVTRQF